MSDPEPNEVTLTTIHEDLNNGFAEVKTALADVKTTLVTGFRSIATRESTEEMVRLLREHNRLQEERLTHLDVRIREQHVDLQQAVRALIEGQQALHQDIQGLIARLDTVIKGRGDGGATS